MTSPTDAFTRNSFIDKVMSFIPEDPLTQAKFMYYLTCIVFLGLLGYGLTSWYSFFTIFSLKPLFSALFMTAIALMSLLGLKQTRINYIMIRDAMEQFKKELEPKIESKEEMLKSFKKK